MASGFDDMMLESSGRASVKLPKAFGASDALGSVVALQTNNPLGEQTIYFELFDKKGSAELLTKATAKNFLEYIKKDIYEGMIFHRSVPGFVVQGGGFSAPDVSLADGGMPSELENFGPIENQPGNSNLRGTVAMAKIGGQPDSATNQFFVNLGDNVALDTQNSGFTVFGKVLGQGMDIVDTLASAQIYDFSGVFSQLPLWDLRTTDEGGVDLLPSDYLRVDSTEKLKPKKQPFTLTAESSDEDLVTVKVTKKNKIKLKAVAGAVGQAEISVTALSSVDGSMIEDSFDVIIGEAASQRVQQDALARRKTIDVLVDGGTMDDPFYRFYDSDGVELDNFKINVKKKYRFSRLDGASTHPFYISDFGGNNPASNALKLKGSGDFDDGIAGDESMTLRIKKSERKAFKANGELTYFCTSHPSMAGLIPIKGQSKSSSDPIATNDAGSAFDENGYYRISDAAEQSMQLI